MSEYRNDQAQLDTYWRRLPETDDPKECIEYLLDWWRSKRGCELALAGEAEFPKFLDDAQLAEIMVSVEDEAIETLLDALAGTKAPTSPEPPEDRRDPVEACRTAERVIRECMPEAAWNAICGSPDYMEWVKARIALEEAVAEAR